MGRFADRYLKHVAEQNARFAAPAPARTHVPEPTQPQTAQLPSEYSTVMPGSHYGSAYHDDFDFDEDEDSDFEDEDELEEASPEAIHNAVGHYADPHDPLGMGKGSLITTPLDDHYRGEHIPGSKMELVNNIKGLPVSNTRYAQEANEYKSSIVDGKLHMPNGDLADTEHNKRPYLKDKDQRMNFVMDGHGNTHVMDVTTETMNRADRAKEKGETSTERYNHSTMLAGGDVAGAGNIKVNQGKVDVLEDGSGHYKPSVTQTAQVAKQLQAQGVMDPMRSTIDLQSREDWRKHTLVSGTELNSYDEGLDNPMQKARDKFARTGDKKHLDKPYQQIEERHENKTSMLDELKSRVPEDSKFTGMTPHLYSKPSKAPSISDFGESYSLESEVEEFGKYGVSASREGYSTPFVVD